MSASINEQKHAPSVKPRAWFKNGSGEKHARMIYGYTKIRAYIRVRAKAPTARKIRRVIQASVGRVTAKTFLRVKTRARPAHVCLRAMRIRATARVCVHVYSREEVLRCFHATGSIPGVSLSLARLSCCFFFLSSRLPLLS